MAKSPIFFSNIAYVEQRAKLVAANQTYPGTLVKIDLSKAFIKVDKHDAKLMSLPRMAPLKVELTDDNGITYAMTSFLVSKKLPEVEFEVNDKIKKIGEARKHQRIKTSIWCELVNAKRGENNSIVFTPYSDCNIADVSVGGVKIVTKNEFPLGKMLVFSFLYEKYNKKIFFRGEVRSRKKGRYGMWEYGIEFYKPDQNFLAVVNKIIENPLEV